MDRSDFFAYRFPSTHATLCFRQVRVSAKIRVLPLELCTNLRTWKILPRHADRRASAINNDSSRSVVYSTNRWRRKTCACNQQSTMIAGCWLHLASSSVYCATVDLALVTVALVPSASADKPKFHDSSFLVASWGHPCRHARLARMSRECYEENWSHAWNSCYTRQNSFTDSLAGILVVKLFGRKPDRKSYIFLEWTSFKGQY